MSQQGKRKTKGLLHFYTLQKIESFLAYSMRILSSCMGVGGIFSRGAIGDFS